MSEPIVDGLSTKSSSWKDKLKFWKKDKPKEPVSLISSLDPIPQEITHNDIKRVREGTYKRFAATEIEMDQNEAQNHFVRAVKKLQETNRWNDEAKADLFEIAEKSSLEGHKLIDRPPGKWSIFYHQNAKEKMMRIYSFSPELARAMARNKIVSGGTAPLVHHFLDF